MTWTRTGTGRGSSPAASREFRPQSLQEDWPSPQRFFGFGVQILIFWLPFIPAIQVLDRLLFTIGFAPNLSFKWTGTLGILLNLRRSIKNTDKLFNVCLVSN